MKDYKCAFYTVNMELPIFEQKNAKTSQRIVVTDDLLENNNGWKWLTVSPSFVKVEGIV